jgi:hypothetical protein
MAIYGRKLQRELPNISNLFYIKHITFLLKPKRRGIWGIKTEDF